MRLSGIVVSMSVVLLAGCEETSTDCMGTVDPSPVGDRLLAALHFLAISPARHCGKMSGGGGELEDASDGTGVISPGTTVPFMAAWRSGSAQSVNLSFGGGTFVTLPLPGVDQARGVVALPAFVDPDVCNGLDAVCHALMCCMQIVTPSGTYSAPVAQQMVIDCTGGEGCPPPYNMPPGSCGPGTMDWPDPGDLAGPPEDMAGCSPRCSGATPWCNSERRCVACLQDGDCPSGSTCRATGPLAGSCVQGCATDADCHRGGVNTGACCAGSCVDVQRDVNNCGACGDRCTRANATATCVGGTCALLDCLANWGNCDGEPSNGCEDNLRTDARNCGACGSVCQLPHAISACANGCYVTGCDAGYDDCDADSKSGCEVALDSDPANCGACGNACSIPNANATCSKGMCLFAGCVVGFLDCDGIAKNGCEINGVLDKRNCGACGNVCPNGTYCNGGKCQ